jgi:DNA-binding MarR family transcriptional regulator
MGRSRARSSAPLPDPTLGLAFLLAQVGAHASGAFADRMEPLGLTPPQVGILGNIAQADGLSQQALSEKLGLFPSRLVAMIDELEQRGLVERRDSPRDRRPYAL